MMLNIKLAELQENYYSFLPIAIIFGFIFLVELLFLFRSEFVFLDIFNESSIVFLSDFLNISSAKTDFNTMFGVNSNIKTISIALFNNYLFYQLFHCLTY